MVEFVFDLTEWIIDFVLGAIPLLVFLSMMYSFFSKDDEAKEQQAENQKEKKEKNAGSDQPPTVYSASNKQARIENKQAKQQRKRKGGKPNQKKKKIEKESWQDDIRRFAEVINQLNPSQSNKEQSHTKDHSKKHPTSAQPGRLAAQAQKKEASKRKASQTAPARPLEVLTDISSSEKPAKTSSQLKPNEWQKAIIAKEILDRPKAYRHLGKKNKT